MHIYVPTEKLLFGVYLQYCLKRLSRAKNKTETMKMCFEFCNVSALSESLDAMAHGRKPNRSGVNSTTLLYLSRVPDVQEPEFQEAGTGETATLNMMLRTLNGATVKSSRSQYVEAL